jgi:segregation and condensation protein B
MRRVRLSQASIDTLSLVAYRQPISREDIDRLRGTKSSAILNQLVRRQLLHIERPPDKPRQAFYTTTERFLELLGLESLDDLPQQLEL